MSRAEWKIEEPGACLTISKEMEVALRKGPEGRAEDKEALKNPRGWSHRAFESWLTDRTCHDLSYASVASCLALSQRKNDVRFTKS